MVLSAHEEVDPVIEQHAVDHVSEGTRQRIDNVSESVAGLIAEIGSQESIDVDDVETKLFPIGLNLGIALCDVCRSSPLGTKPHDVDMYSQTDLYYATRMIGRLFDRVRIGVGSNMSNILALTAGIHIMRDPSIPEELKLQILGSGLLYPRYPEGTWEDIFLFENVGSRILVDAGGFNMRVHEICALRLLDSEAAHNFARNVLTPMEARRQELMIVFCSQIHVMNEDTFPNPIACDMFR